MKKIPTLFFRKFENHKVVEITPRITYGCEEAFKNGIATVKVDGSCCAIINGEFYKRYDAKKGRKVPEGAIPCCDPDEVTGHWPHWVKIDISNPKPNDKWYIKALDNTTRRVGPLGNNATYEAVGRHFNGNPYGFEKDYLVKHGAIVVQVERTYEAIRDCLERCDYEGLVFWLNGEPVCKIKRTDFGFDWPIKEK